jgi:phospholipase A1/A2
MPIHQRAPRIVRAIVLLALGAAGPEAAWPVDAAALVRCAQMKDDDAARLRCYDALAQPATGEDALPGAPADAAVATHAASTTPAASIEPPRGTCGTDEASALCSHWDLVHNNDEALFRLLPHKPNYILPAHYSSSPNSRPDSANFGPAPDQDLDHVDLKFQFSLKAKIVEHFLWDRADLWFAYTQQSSWQAYNGAQSRPFRDNNYEPELMTVFPLSTPMVWGWNARFVNVALVHQSNGQADPLSRSWNRVYAQLGVDRKLGDGELGVSIRPWYRIPEHSGDDNPDIDHYLGYGDLQGTYRFSGGTTLGMLLRNNLQIGDNRGSVQVDFAWPLSRVKQPLGGQPLRFYVQFFTGFGETLLDYNHYQTSIGLGFMLSDWM